MTTSQSQTSQSQLSQSQTSQSHQLISCECLVNSKIPLNLFPKLETRLRRHLQAKVQLLPRSSNSLELLRDDEVLAATIESLKIFEEENSDLGDQEGEGKSLKSSDKIKVFLYQYPPSNDKPEPERKLNISEDLLSEEDGTNFYFLETFPNSAYQGLWESLQFDSSVKASILAYIGAIFRFSLLGLTEKDEISFNRILLLHGPPGTGKSTLAKALVFKLSTRLYYLQNHYRPSNKEPNSTSTDHLPDKSFSTSSDSPPYTNLICLTLNSSQLFSRFFSESSKSVQRAFERVRELACRPGNFVCVLIDEVESLAMSRKHSADADQLRSFPNILYITTSNYPSLVDAAFIDRVDWSFEVGLPSEKVIYALLIGSLRVMASKGLLKGADDLAGSAQAAQLMGGLSNDLLTVCNALKGQSGRAVKRLPLMAYAAFLQKHPNSHQASIPQFIQSLRELISVNK